MTEAQKEQGIGLGLLQGLAVTLRTMTKRSVTVQFASLSAITPRVRAGRSGFTCGYCTVTERLSIVRRVTDSP